MNVYYSADYVGSGFAFETTRKAGWVAEALGLSPIASLALVAPPSLSGDQVAQVHDPQYVRAVQTGLPRSLAESQNFAWDAGLWPMVLASNGGIVAAGLDALEHGLSGSLSSGLHHARRASGAGYCTFNGLVLAAHAALNAGARNVLILDLDAHCGGGTAELIALEPRIWQVDVSVDTYDSYEGSSRIKLRLVDRGADYLAAIGLALEQLVSEAPRFDLCLYNAGMDPFEGCPDGALEGITREVLATREQMVFDWCRAQALPVAFALAGGYVGAHLDRAGLVDLHLLTLEAAAACSRHKPAS